MGQMAVRSVQQQFEELDAWVKDEPTRPGLVVRAAHGLKALGGLVKRLAAGRGPVPATERG
jgi:hypothetical protein